MKNIWVVNYYSDVPGKVGNPRHYEFAKYLTAHGYHVRVFFGDRERKLHKPTILHFGQRYFSEDYEDIAYTHIAAIPYHENNIVRGISIWCFALRLLILRKRFERPDIILFNIHAPFDYPVIWCAKRLNAKLIVEAWDLWPDSFVRFGLMSANNPIVKFFYMVERKMYEHGDKVIFTMEGGIDYLKERGWLSDTGGKILSNNIVYINNGVNLKMFEHDSEAFPTNDKDLLREDIIKVVYLGSIRLVNHVKDLISAAENLKDNSKIKFIIIGDGPERPILEQYCRDRNLKNVLFKQKHIQYCEVADIVSHASINVINYQKEFGKYGVSSGKFFQYLAAGRPILCNRKLNYCEITKNNIGIAKELNSPEEYADAILTLARLTHEELDNMRVRINAIAEKFDYPKLAAELEEVIREIS